MTVRRYGANKYGDGKLYGSSDAQDAYVWDVSFDWDGDGVLESNEADYLIGVSISRGRQRLLGSSGDGFEAITTGSAILTFKNDDRRFDAWYASSPLYPDVGYGKDVRVRVKDLNTGTIYNRFYGVITDIQPSGYGVNAKVQIHAEDGLEYLRNYGGRASMQTAITPDAAIGKVLDAVNWPPRWGRDLDTSSETIPYWWSSGNKKAMNEIEDLALSFLGYFFVDASGQAKYVKRSSVSSSVADYPQEYLLKDIGNPQPYDIQRNVTRIKVHPRTLAATGTIWQLSGNTPSVLPGSANALVIWANYTYNNSETPAINVVTPVATTDYTVNTAADGGGTDLTGSFTVAMTDFGDTAKLVITNNSASTGYVTALKIRGDAVYEQNATDVTYPSDLTTVSAPRELFFDLIWQQDINVAMDITNVLGPFYAGLHPTPNIKIVNRPALQFTPDLFDIVTASLDYIGVTGQSYRVSGIEEDTDTQYGNCQSVQTRLYLEPYISADDFMIWDTASDWDTTTVFGW